MKSGTLVLTVPPTARPSRATLASPAGSTPSIRERTSRARMGADPPVATPITTSSRSIRAGVWKSLRWGLSTTLTWAPAPRARAPSRVSSSASSSAMKTSRAPARSSASGVRSTGSGAVNGVSIFGGAPSGANHSSSAGVFRNSRSLARAGSPQPMITILAASSGMEARNTRIVLLSGPSSGEEGTTAGCEPSASPPRPANQIAFVALIGFLTAMARSLLPLNALRAFEAAARHLNFSRAADELSVTPGAVSQQIQNLEDYVGAALFKRTPKGLLLTDAAQTALPALREAFDRLAEAASMLTAAVDGRRLTLTAAPSFAAKWLVPRLGRFEELHPQVDVWLSAGLELVDLTAGEVDVAIRYGAGRYPGLEVRRLIGETVIPVLSPALAETNPLNVPSDLANHILLHDGSPEPDDSCPDWTIWLAARGPRRIDGARGPRLDRKRGVEGKR